MALAVISISTVSTASAAVSIDWVTIGDPGNAAQSAANRTHSFGSGARPITYVSWFDAARYTNWLHNGQGTGDTETGAYTLNGATSGNAVASDPEPSSIVLTMLFTAAIAARRKR